MAYKLILNMHMHSIIIYSIGSTKQNGRHGKNIIFAYSDENISEEYGN